MKMAGRLVQAIGLIALVTGFTQMVSPGTILAQVGGDANPAARHFFGIVGMFMMLFGGATAHAVHTSNAPVLALSMLQKLGAAAAVTLGILNSIFGSIAWVVAAFDFATAMLTFVYWRNVNARS